MSRTSTKVLNLEKFRIQGQSAVTVVKLMMACNDLCLANEALSEWKKKRFKHVEAASDWCS